MADTIERTIYKLEIDDSGYIAGVDRLSASTNKLTTAQEQANKTLKANEEQLKKNAAIIEKQKKELEAFTGTDERVRKQLEASLQKSIAAEKLLTETVNNSRKAYEAATKAKQDFANTSDRATQLQNQTTGGKIPTAPPPPSQFLNQIRGAVAQGALSLGDLPDVVRETIPQFENLRKVIADVEAHMATLNAESEEFKQLSPIVEQGKNVLQQYDKAAEGAAGKTLSLRSQIRQGREELVKMEQAGKANTKEFFELEKRVASLTDAYGDQQDRIRILASDTRALDFGKAAITSAASAFQVYTSISILAGDESAELQKKTMQLFAAMQLLTALEQLSNTVKRGGVLATNAQAASQAVYTAVVGASTGALKSFRIALLATGIGAVVVGLGFLIAKLMQAKDALTEAEEQQKLFKEVNQEAAKAVGDQAAKLEIYRNKLNDLSIPEKERVKVAKEYNKIADETNKLDLKQIDNLELINQKIDAQNKLIIQRALSTAALSKITDAASKQVEAELELNQALARAGLTEQQVTDQVTAAIQGQIDARDRQTKSLEGYSNLQDRTSNNVVKSVSKEVIAINNLISNRNRAAQSVQTIVDSLSSLITTEGLTTFDKGTAAKTIDNVYLQKLKELQARLAGVTAKSFESEGTIRKQFAASLEKELFSIDELLKKKQLTSPQATILKGIIEKISTTELDQALGVFRDKQAAALDKIQSSIDDAILEKGKQAVNNIRDEFERERQTIEQESISALAILSKKQADLVKQIDDDTNKGLISPQIAKRKKFILTLVFGDLADQVQAARATREVELAYKVFQNLLEDISSRASVKDVEAAERLAQLVQDERDKLDAGVITFKQFQDSVTEITKQAAAVRKEIRRAELQDQLNALNISIEASDDPQIIERLKKRQLEIRGALATLDTETAGAAEDPNEKRKDSVAEYAAAVGDLTQSIISFWQKANEAESAALDRSISLQEKRVEAAGRIAARGNAQYLKQEEDRLKELQVKKENAARRELAINAALQASQLLVAITGAISKIATPGIGIAEVIGSMAVIFSSLAAGYGLVKSLQGTQPKLAKGTKRVRRDGHPSGTDTIPAWLNEGEAVIPTDNNKAYHPTVSAIYDKTIPAEHLNNFVKNYHSIKGVPRPDYGRIKDAAESSIGSEGRLAGLISEQNRKIDENNDLQRQTLRAMSKMSINATIDRDGVAIAVNEYVQQMLINKRL